MATLITHGACGRQWTGLRREHCPACHETFNSTKAGDRHRRAGKCLDPAAAGLLAVDHPWGRCWQTPGTYNPRKGK